MSIQTISTLTSKSILKIISLVFGYAFWLILAQQQPLKITQTIPLSFYLSENQFDITAPNEITIKLLGKRSDLQKIDVTALGINIDINHLTDIGTYPVKIDTNNLFLPNHVKLLYYTPVMVNLELSKKIK